MPNFLNLDMPGYRSASTDDGQGMFLLPPKASACQTCGREHEPHMPHDPTTVYWQMSRQMIGWPIATWPEAWSHCDPAIQEHFRTALTDMGVDVDAGELRPRKARA